MKNFITGLKLFGFLCLCSVSFELMNEGDIGFYIGAMFLLALAAFGPSYIIKSYFNGG